MANATNNPVKDLVEDALRAEGVLWHKHLRRCSAAGHKVRSSYGGATWENVGKVVEICAAADGEKCNLHLRPLPVQLADESRLRLLRQICELEPTPAGVNLSSTLEMMSDLRSKVRMGGDAPSSPDLVERRGRPRGRASLPSQGHSSAGHRSTGSSPPRRASSSTAPTSTSRSTSRASLASSTSSHRGLGRPVNPTCEVIVYVYLQGRHNPMIIQAVGTPRDSVVEFHFAQPKINSDLGIVAADRAKPTFTKWNLTIKGWADYPKPHHPVFLAPGERVLYRETTVTNTPNLQHYVALLLPPSLGTDTRPLLPSTDYNNRHRKDARSVSPAPSRYRTVPSSSMVSLDDVFAGSSARAESSVSRRTKSSTPHKVVARRSSFIDRLFGDDAPDGAGKRGVKRAGSSTPSAVGKRRKLPTRESSPNAIDLTGGGPEAGPSHSNRSLSRGSTDQAMAGRSSGSGLGGGMPAATANVGTHSLNGPAKDQGGRLSGPDEGYIVISDNEDEL